MHRQANIAVCHQLRPQTVKDTNRLSLERNVLHIFTKVRLWVTITVRCMAPFGNREHEEKTDLTMWKEIKAMVRLGPVLG